MVFGIFIQSLLGVPNTYFKNAVFPNVYSLLMFIVWAWFTTLLITPNIKSYKFHPLTKNQKQTRPFAEWHSHGDSWMITGNPHQNPKKWFFGWALCSPSVSQQYIDYITIHNPWTILNLPFTGPFNDVFPKDGLNGQLRDFGPCIFISAWSNSLCLRRFGIPKLTLKVAIPRETLKESLRKVSLGLTDLRSYFGGSATITYTVRSLWGFEHRQGILRQKNGYPHDVFLHSTAIIQL